MLPFSAQHRADSGIAGGDATDVELSLDTKPREAEMPADLAAALAEAGGLEPVSREQAPNRQRADFDCLEAAKAPERGRAASKRARRSSRRPRHFRNNGGSGCPMSILADARQAERLAS
jgi:hypothetical protein